MATLKYSKSTELIFLKTKDLTICFHLMIGIENITKIKDINNGFFTIETNYGEEFIDFIELIDINSEYSDFEKEKMKRIIKDINIDNTKLEVA